jgi:hypothetical protein
LRENAAVLLGGESVPLLPTGGIVTLVAQELEWRSPRLPPAHLGEGGSHTERSSHWGGGAGGGGAGKPGLPPLGHLRGATVPTVPVSKINALRRRVLETVALESRVIRLLLTVACAPNGWKMFFSVPGLFGELPSRYSEHYWR